MEGTDAPIDGGACRADPGTRSAGHSLRGALDPVDRSHREHRLQGRHPSDVGTGFAFFGATTSDLNGPDAFLDAWNGDEPAGEADLHRDFDQPVDVTWNGTVLSGSFPIVDSGGDPAGTRDVLRHPDSARRSEPHR